MGNINKEQRMGWLRGMLERRTAAINKAAGIPPKANAGKANAEKDKKKAKKKDTRTKVSQFTSEELAAMSDEKFLSLEQD